jgi:hypothetical protein
MDKPERSIAELSQAIEQAIDAYIDAIAPYHPDVPRDVLRQCEINVRSGRCQCRAYTFKPLWAAN